MDRIVFTVFGSSSPSRPVAEIDLSAGVLVRSLHTEPHPPRPIPPATLAALREAAATLHLEGSFRVRASQFVLGETWTEITLDGVTVKQEILDEGGGFGGARDVVYQVCCGRWTD